MAASGESESIYSAARFGWNLAMLRGLLRDGPQADQAAGIHRTDFALPLGEERSWKEQTIEIEAVVRGLAQSPNLAMDVALTELSYQAKDAKGPVTDRLEVLTKALAAARESGSRPDIERAWNALDGLFAAWTRRSRIDSRTGRRSPLDTNWAVV